MSHSPLDTAPASNGVTWRQWAVLAVVMLILIIDGLDIQLLSLVAPVIIEDWKVTRSAFGLPMSAALVGMAVGAAAGGFLGDRLGRRAVLIAAVLLFGCATLGASFSGGVGTLTAMRLLSGLGFGAAGPCGVALVSEWLPRRLRAGSSALLSVGTPLGSIAAASVVLSLLPHFGWRGCFLLCGGITLVLAALSISLPESPSFLAKAGNADKAECLVARIAGGAIDCDVAADPSTNGPAKVSGRLFERGNLRLNIGSWMLFFSLQFIAYAFAAWSPVFLTQAGFSLEQALAAIFAFNSCAVAAALLVGALLGRLGSRVAVIVACGGALTGVALTTLVLGTEVAQRSSARALLAVIGSGVAGGGTGLGIATLYGLLAYTYPTHYRSSGIGLGLMMGRLGAICIALGGGALLTVGGLSTRPFFLVLLALGLVGLIGVLLIDRHVPFAPRKGRTIRVVPLSDSDA